MNHFSILGVGLSLFALVAACDPESGQGESNLGEARARALPQTVDEMGHATRIPVSRAELAARGLAVLDIEDDEPDLAMGVIEDPDDERLTPQMSLTMRQHAAEASADVVTYVCPEFLNVNVWASSGSSGWGAVGFVGGNVNSTSMLDWFTGATQLRCHGTKTLTPGYSYPVYVARMTEVGAVCFEHASGGDYWFTCQIEPPEGGDTNCCETGHGAGCDDPTIEDCVCASDSYCCTTNWDSICVNEVTSLGCGTC